LKKPIKIKSKETQSQSSKYKDIEKRLSLASGDRLKPFKDITKFNKIFRKVKQRFKRNTKPKVVTIVNMELQNGNFDTFYIEYEFDSFEYNNGRYIFDNDSKYYHVGFKCWCYDYREGFCLPIKKVPFPINDVRKAFEENTDIDFEYSLNAKNLQQFQISKVIESVLSGQALGEQFKKVIIMVVICLILCLVNVLVGMQLYSMVKALGGA